MLVNFALWALMEEIKRKVRTKGLFGFSVPQEMLLPEAREVKSACTVEATGITDVYI